MDINVEVTENDYQEITGEPTSNGPTFPDFTDTRETDGGLPQEYHQPPPFAPGY